MILLPLLDVVFVGLVGADPGHVQNQLSMILEDHQAVARKLPAPDAAALARHDDRAADVVKDLHVDGLISSSIVVANGHKTLRIVIYDADGNLRSMSETPLTGKTLASGDLEVLHDNLGDEVQSLIAKAAKKKPVAKATPKPEAKKPEAKKPEPKKPEVVTATAPMKAPSDIDFDQDNPLGDAKSAPQDQHAAAPTETADVSADEIMAMTGGNETDTTTTASSGTPEERALHLQAGVGFGVASRSFSPGPATITSYDTSAVGAIRLDARAEPTKDLAIGVAFEHTLGMTSDLRTETAATALSRWEANAGYTVTHGAVQLTPIAGFGRRVFAIESSDPTRSPDNSYDYLILGGSLAATLGSHVTLLGSAAFEPVVGGADPMAMELGSASRWAMDVAAGVEVRPIEHVYVRAVADYQRFSWSWDMAGARGAGGATDSYPSATLQLGARY